MITVLARQALSRTEQAGVIARAALAVAAERMGGRPPAPFVQDEKVLRPQILREVRQRLGIAPDDRSDEALRTIEDALDTEMEAIAEPVEVEAALVRAATLVVRVTPGDEASQESANLRTSSLFDRMTAEAREESASSRTPSLFDRVTATFRRERSQWRGQRGSKAAEDESATENAGEPEKTSKRSR
jgi:hypothetical protein